MTDSLSHSGATFSACRTWRYALWRRWDSSKSPFVVIGLPPSTADELQDDRETHVCRLLKSLGVRLECFGMTPEGYPKHPLYLPNAAPLVTYPSTQAIL